MADTPEKKVAIFTFKRDEGRRQKLENLKKRFRQDLVLKLLNLENFDELDESELETKLNSQQVLENLQQANENLAEEVGKRSLVNNRRLQEEIRLLQVQDKERAENLAGDRHQLNQRIKEQEAHLECLENEIKAKEQAEQDEKNKEELRLLQLREEKAKAALAGMQQAEAVLAGELQKLENQRKELEQCSLQKEAIEQAAFIAGLPEETRTSLLQFGQECKKQGKDDLFLEALNDLRVSSITEEGERSFYPEGDKNQHFFKLTDGKLDHRIKNLGGTGLDLCIVENEFSLLRNEDLTADQLKALAEYCYRNGLEIKDYRDLEQLKVVRDGQEIGNAKDELQKSLNKLAEDERLVFEEQNGQAVGCPRTPIEEYRPNMDDPMHQFIPKVPTAYELNVNPTNMMEASKNRMKLGLHISDEGLYRITRNFNSTVISVYANENDKLVDGELDKNGKQVHSKLFSVEITFDRPPTGRFYMGQTKEFKADHARTMLDAFKNAGCKYFILPNIAEIGGKPTGKAFMEASVKTGMVPYLKRSKNEKDATDIGVPDLVTVFEAMEKEPEMTGNKKVEYMMRWHRELTAYMKGQPEKQGDLSLYAQKFKAGACFANFQASYLEQLEDYMRAGVEGKLEGPQWDKADQVTATIAMAKILEQLQKGELNGRPFNPMDTNSPTNGELLKKTLKQYMEAERSEIEQKISDKVTADTNQHVTDSKENKAIADLLKEPASALKTIQGRLKALGVTIEPNIPYISTNYTPRTRSRTNSNANNRGQSGRNDDDNGR